MRKIISLWMPSCQLHVPDPLSLVPLPKNKLGEHQWTWIKTGKLFFDVGVSDCGLWTQCGHTKQMCCCTDIPGNFLRWNQTFPLFLTSHECTKMFGRYMTWGHMGLVFTY